MTIFKQKFWQEPKDTKKTLKSYVREWIWKNIESKEAVELEKYIYEKNYQLGKYKA